MPKTEESHNKEVLSRVDEELNIEKQKPKTVLINKGSFIISDQITQVSQNLVPIVSAILVAELCLLT